MKIQKFKGDLKGTVTQIEGLILYKDEDTGTYRFTENLRWASGDDYLADTYDIDEFDKLEEYFEEID